MNLYRISQRKNNDYDTYDSAVVCAESEEAARMIHPSKYETDWNGENEDWSSWCAAKDVDVVLIGEAAEGVAAGVVCASFNAG